MSVINQMLKDLETRKESGDHLPQPDFSPKQSAKRSWLIRLSLLVIAGALAYWFWLVPHSSANDSAKNTAATSVAGQPVTQFVSTSALPDKEPFVEETESNQSEQESLLVASHAAQNQEITTSHGLTPAQLQTPQAASEPSAPPAPPEPTAASEPAAPAAPAKSEPSAGLEPSARLKPLTQESSPKPSVPPQPAQPSFAPVKPAAKAKIQRHTLSPKKLAIAKLNEAREQLREGQPQKAEQAYLTSLRMKPKQKEARIELAQLYLQQGRYSQVWQQAELGLKFYPNEPELARLKAATLFQQGYTDKAWQTLVVVPDSEQLSDAFLILKAGLASKLGHFELAYIHYVKLSDRAPNSGRWWFGRAISAEQMQRPEEAAQGYQKALQSGNLSSASQQYAAHRLQILGAQR